MDSLDVTTTIPLLADSKGVIRVGTTRVTLEAVVLAFINGSTAEEIAFQYPVLDLSDVYAVIGYYLKHQPAIEKYIKNSQVVSRAIQESVQKKFPVTDTRQRLITRQAKHSKSSF